MTACSSESKKKHSSASHTPYSYAGERNRKLQSIYKRCNIQTGHTVPVTRRNRTERAGCFQDWRLSALLFTELLPLFHIKPLQNKPSSTTKLGRIWAVQFPDNLSFLEGLNEKIKKSVFFVFRWILEIQHRPGKSCYFLISKGLSSSWTRNKRLIMLPICTI